MLHTPLLNDSQSEKVPLQTVPKVSPLEIPAVVNLACLARQAKADNSSST